MNCNLDSTDRCITALLRPRLAPLFRTKPVCSVHARLVTKDALVPAAAAAKEEKKGTTREYRRSGAKVGEAAARQEQPSYPPSPSFKE